MAGKKCRNLLVLWVKLNDLQIINKMLTISEAKSTYLDSPHNLYLNKDCGGIYLKYYGFEIEIRGRTPA